MFKYFADVRAMFEEVEKASGFFDIGVVLGTDHAREKLREIMFIVFPINFDGLWKEKTVPLVRIRYKKHNLDTNLRRDVRFPLECLLGIRDPIGVYPGAWSRGICWRCVFVLLFEKLVREIWVLGEFLVAASYSAQIYTTDGALTKMMVNARDSVESCSTQRSVR
jgi:hypothetical protein